MQPRLPDSDLEDIDPPLNEGDMVLQLIGRAIDGDLDRAERIELVRRLATDADAGALALSLVELEARTIRLALAFDQLVPPDEMAAKALSPDAPWNRDPVPDVPWSRRSGGT